MKNLIFKTLLLATTLCVGISTFAMEVQAEEINPSMHYEVTIQESSDNEYGIVPYADIIEWRYKIVDERLYRRQYNYSKGQWVGEWELC